MEEEKKEWMNVLFNELMEEGKKKWMNIRIN